MAVIGSGSWATAIVKILTDNGQHVNWWVRNPASIEHIQQRHHNPQYLSHTYLNTEMLGMSNDLEKVIASSEMLVVAIPSAFLLDSFAHLEQGIFRDKKVMSAIKGILPNEKHQLLNEYLEDRHAFSIEDYYTLMGPCHAEEVAAERLSYLTLSGLDNSVNEDLANRFKTWYINTVTGNDVWGSQYAAVLKNVYAIGAGMAHGLEYGDNFQSVFVANAAREMGVFLSRLLKVKNPDQPPVEYSNSVYLGDLLVTCYSLFSRNRNFGSMIGKGYSVKVAKMEMNMEAEGYLGSRGIEMENKDSVNADIPIAHTIYKILWEDLPAKVGFQLIEGVLQ